MYSPASNLYYPQQQQQQQQRHMHPNYKQLTAAASPMYNFVPMMSPTSFQQGNSMSVPILLQQQPTGQIQYVFPAQQPHSLSCDGQYMPVGMTSKSLVMYQSLSKTVGLPTRYDATHY